MVYKLDITTLDILIELIEKDGKDAITLALLKALRAQHVGESDD